MLGGVCVLLNDVEFYVIMRVKGAGHLLNKKKLVLRNSARVERLNNVTPLFQTLPKKLLRLLLHLIKNSKRIRQLPTGCRVRLDSLPQTVSTVCEEIYICTVDRCIWRVKVRCGHLGCFASRTLLLLLLYEVRDWGSLWIGQ